MPNVFLSSLLLAAASPGEAETPAAALEIGLVRTTITVSDLERSRRFYVDGLGFQQGFDGDITSDSTRLLLGLRLGQTARFVVLRNAAAVRGKPAPATGIGLLHLSGRARSPSPKPGVAPSTGHAMLALETSDIAETERRLRTLCARILVRQLTSHEGQHREIVVLDPDGVRIHIVQLVTPPA